MLRRLSYLVSCIVLTSLGMVLAAEPRSLPAHPRLLFNAQGIEQLREKIARDPWKAVWASFQAGVEKGLGKELALPPRGGNWSHNYVCPMHGARLEQGRQLGAWRWEHRCPAGPHVLQSDPSQARFDFDGNSIGEAHRNYAEAVRDLGVVYQVTRDRRYADRARLILLAYADRYLKYAMHDNHGRRVTGNGGRVASQPLSEAVWLAPMAQGADLVWDALAPAERDRLAKDLFRPAIEETILNRAKSPVIHNIQCHRNSAVGLVGLLLDDPRLIDHAIDGISGYRANMAKGVQADGGWYEGSWGYHFYTIRGTWPLVEAARNCGIDLYGPEFKRMFDAPLRLATPTFRLPAFNDGSEVSVAHNAEFYELAYARYRDPSYAALLKGSPRSGPMALWFGAPLDASRDITRPASHNAESSGYAMLQRGSDEQATWLCLKYGPHGGGHGHFDKNQFVLYSRGQCVMPDGGTHAYGSSLHRDWDKETFAHNTVVVDGKTQSAATGRCLAFGSAGGAAYAMTDAGEIYPGVKFVRTAVLLHEDLVVFVDSIRADTDRRIRKSTHLAPRDAFHLAERDEYVAAERGTYCSADPEPRTIDLVCHHHGVWEELPDGRAFDVPDRPGYRCLRQATVRSGEGFDLKVRLGGRACRIVLAPGAPTEAITGTGVGAHSEDRVPLVVFRRVATQTVFAWAVSLSGAEISLAAEAPARGPIAVRLKDSRGRWRLDVDPDRGRVAVTPQE